VIAGGLVPRFPEIFKRSDFLARYLAKGRFAEYLARAEVVLLTHPAPGLLGAARALIDADSETPVAA
jgi:glucokinase